MATFGSGPTARYVLSSQSGSSPVDRQLFLDLCEQDRGLADSGSRLVLDCLSAGLLVVAIAAVEFAVPFVAASALGASSLVIAGLGICRFAPQVLLARTAALVVERYDQRAVMLGSELLRVLAFLLSALALAVGPGWGLAVFGLANIALACGSVLTSISTQVLVPAVFPDKDLPGIYARLSIAHVGKRQSRPWILSDELWSLIQPLSPEPAPKQAEGRPRVPDRQALCGILFVLHTGIQWEYLPQELGLGSGMTCWRRWVAWNEAGARDQLHLVLLKGLRVAKKLDWPRAVYVPPRRTKPPNWWT
ncbi:transposase [Streptomyces sp. KS 21]|nr:transposase [Streptomyces sp. KS 21]